MRSNHKIILAALMLLLSCNTGWSAPESAAKITGPIPVTAMPGDASRNYPFFTTKHLAEKHDYIEEEFYVEGVAVEYAGAPDQTATIAPGGPYPYKTRAIVRRPRSARCVS